MELCLFSWLVHICHKTSVFRFVWSTATFMWCWRWCFSMLAGPEVTRVTERIIHSASTLKFSMKGIGSCGRNVQCS
jgi:hypothetical protein